MAAWTTNFRYSLRYTGSYNYDSVSRTIGGLNVGAPAQDTGADFNPAALSLVSTINSFTMGSISNIRWVSEREMTL